MQHWTRLWSAALVTAQPVFIPASPRSWGFCFASAQGYWILVLPRACCFDHCLSLDRNGFITSLVITGILSAHSLKCWSLKISYSHFCTAFMSWPITNQSCSCVNYVCVVEFFCGQQQLCAFVRSCCTGNSQLRCNWLQVHNSWWRCSCKCHLCK